MSPTLAATTLLPLPSHRHSFSLPLSLSSLSTALGPPISSSHSDRPTDRRASLFPPRPRDAMEPPHAEQAIAAVAAGGEGGTASPGTGLEGAACLTFFCFVQISGRAYGRADLWWLPDVTAWYENVWLLQGR
jgi:hypothetical protein